MPNDAGEHQPSDAGDKTPEENDVTFDEDELENLDEDTSKKLKTLDAQRKHYKEKAVDSESGKSYRELYEELKKKPSEPEAKKPTSNDDNGEDKSWKERVEFLLENNVDKNDFRIISAFAKDKGVTLREASQDDEVKELISLRQAKREQERKTPKPDSSNAPTFDKNDRDVAKMSDEEFAEYEEKARQESEGSASV